MYKFVQCQRWQLKLFNSGTIIFTCPKFIISYWQNSVDWLSSQNCYPVINNSFVRIPINTWRSTYKCSIVLSLNMIQLLWDYHSPLPRCVTCPLTASSEGLQSPFLWPGTFLQPLSAFHSAPWFHHPEKANKKFCSAQRCQYLWHFKYDINVHVFYPGSKFMNFNHKVSF